MKKVWNVKTREYDWVQEGVWVSGNDYDCDGAYEKWNSRFPKMARKTVVLNILQRYVDARRSFVKMHEFLEEIEKDVVALNHGYVATYLGKGNHKIAYTAIPQVYRAGIQAIALGTTGPPLDFDRGRHTSCPSISASAHSYREYHLRSNREGRATSAQADGMLLIYYSLGHAAGTYSYHLVTHEFGPGKVEVPLTGGRRDALVKRPWE
jgi:hypothetical protein